MKTMILPLLGPFHVLSPQYNAETLADLLQAFAPDAVVLTSLAEGSLDGQEWQATHETALPLAVVPWARRRKVPLHLLAPVHPDPTAQADFMRYAREYPDAGRQLAAAFAVQEELEAALRRPVTPGTLSGLLELVAREQDELRQAAGPGPATGFVEERARSIAASLPDAGRVAVVAELELAPQLTALLEPEPLPQVTPSARAQAQALVDHAMAGGSGPHLQARLQELEQAGNALAGFARSGLLLEEGLIREARQVLENTANGDFSQPYYLPGYLLARLGQLRDLTGDRELAMKAYRAVRALSWAPEEALEAAAAGLDSPFST